MMIGFPSDRIVPSLRLPGADWDADDGEEAESEIDDPDEEEGGEGDGRTPTFGDRLGCLGWGPL